MIDAAAHAGADAVKFQTFKADKLVTPDAAKAEYQVRQTGAAESQLQMLQRLELSSADHEQLIAYAQQRGILFMSTPFDEESADLLESMGVAVFKLPSGELTNTPFLHYVARKGKPLIVSTGMACLAEVESAVQALEDSENDQFVLLHCVSNYPADPADSNLRAMLTMQAAFGVPIGYSDHTVGNVVSWAAVALGACVIEKHLTLDRNLPGPDHAASAEPQEIAELIRGIREIESALGNGRKQPTPAERSTAAVARKSLVASQDIAEGAILTLEAITVKRPGTGLVPSLRSALVGRKARRAIPRGTLLSLDMVA